MWALTYLPLPKQHRQQEDYPHCALTFHVVEDPGVIGDELPLQICQFSVLATSLGLKYSPGVAGVQPVTEERSPAGVKVIVLVVPRPVIVAVLYVVFVGRQLFAGICVVPTEIWILAMPEPPPPLICVQPPEPFVPYRLAVPVTIFSGSVLHEVGVLATMMITGLLTWASATPPEGTDIGSSASTTTAHTSTMPEAIFFTRESFQLPRAIQPK